MYSLSYTVGKGSMQHALSRRKLGQTFLLKNQTFDGIKCAHGTETRSVLAFLQQVFWRRSFCFTYSSVKTENILANKSNSNEVTEKSKINLLKAVLKKVDFRPFSYIS